MRTDTHCVICGADLPPRTSQRGRTRKYCGRVCTNAGLVELRAPKHGTWKQTRKCPRCDTEFMPNRGFQEFCTPVCRRKARGLLRAEPHPVKVCALPECDEVFTPRRHIDRCCNQAHGRLLTDVESFHKRRAIKQATATRPVRIDEIAARDKNRCHICRRKIGKRVYPHPRSRSLDHLVPLTKGGEHTPENVKLACLGCNVSKGNRGGNEQLLLIG